MSKRRHPGEWVMVAPGAGFLATEDWKRAQIDPSSRREPCYGGCDDMYCTEWSDLSMAPDASGHRAALYHVSECQMRDCPQEESREQKA